MVLVTHATFFVGSRTADAFPTWEAGAQGVSLFFVISGFVMAISAEGLGDRDGAVRYFALSRIVRIVPLYWAVNIAKIAAMLLIPGLIFADPTWSNVILSMLFVFSRNAEGIVETFYGVGWTLNFEMAFYLVVAAALLLRRPPLLICAPVLIATAALSPFRDPDTWPAATALIDDIVLNFLYGMIIARLDMRGMRLPAPWAVLAIAAGGAVILTQPYLYLMHLQYAAVVAGVVALEPRISGRVPRPLMFGGDASYAIYLVHPLLGVAAALVLARLGLPPVPACLGVIAICLAGSALVYVWFERPVTERLRAALIRRPSTRSPAIERHAP